MALRCEYCGKEVPGPERICNDLHPSPSQDRNPKMSKIPEDAVKTAQRMWVEAAEAAGIGGIWSSTELIARAIRDERERCHQAVMSLSVPEALREIRTPTGAQE